ncbi:MAG: phosphoribosyltransferase family protein, partial [Clostridia bacterium]
AFLCNAEILSNKRRILLIDDVITTGATVNECSKILVENGAFSVSCAAIARTPTPQKITIK